MKITNNIYIFKTEKFRIKIDNDWNDSSDLFRGIDFYFGFFKLSIMRSM